MQGKHAGPLPEPARPGPGGEKARAAAPGDAESLVSLALEALAEAGMEHKPEIVEWVVQATLHDPLRGLLVVAEPAEGGAPLGLAAIQACADLRHGWSGRLTCLYVRPGARGRGLGDWLLDHALELARYHGLNHVECDLEGEPAAARRVFESAGFRAQPTVSYRVDLHPLYDDGEV